MRWSARALTTTALALGVVAPVAAQEDVLRVVMHSDLKIIDPIWTTAYISRNHGYMVYDTLLALDETGAVQPQMAESWEVSDDGLTYAFTLRDGLTFHDGTAVTSADVVASLQRWGQRDTMGQKLMDFVDAMEPTGERSFEIRLAEPYGLVTRSIAKPSSNTPFIMPEEVAATPADQQIEDPTGSGPFVFDQEAWEPGNKVVYRKFEDYVPRAEAPSWGAGGKVVNVDTVEWVSMPDAQTAVNALITGEIDIVEQVAHDLLPLVENDPNIGVRIADPLGNQYMFRFNWLHPPFDDPQIRRAALEALNQKDFLDAVIGNPEYYSACAAMFICGTTLATDAGGGIALESDFAASKALLDAAGYDGTPVVLMHSTDLQVLNNLAPVAAQLLRRGGFTVDMRSMDWQTLVSRRARKDPPGEGGWNAFMTSWVAADVMNPIAAAGFNAAGDDAWFGWPEDARLEELRDAFARETDPEKQKALAEEIQVRALEVGTHMHAGQYFVPMAYREDRVSGFVDGPAPYFWEIGKVGG
jgi:peptide/nickel transport system substrate-binding protein